MSEAAELVIERSFNAPRELVWRAWTDPDLLHRWYGPNIETVIHQFDLQPGGAWLNEMKMGGMSDYSKMVFQEVTPGEKLVWHHSSTDADWNIISSPMMTNWPRVLLTTVLFAATGDKTMVHFSWVPMDGTEAEIACFAQMKDAMSGGWGTGFSIMDELLVELQAAST